MSRRPDPDRICAARRDAALRRLTVPGMPRGADEVLVATLEGARAVAGA